MVGTARSRSRLPLRLVALVLVPLVLVACTTSGDVPVPTFDDAAATVQSRPSEVIPGRFIVTVRDDADPAAVASAFGLRPDFTYRHAITGFAGHISDAARAGLMRDARVLRIEPDRTVHAFGVQENATWGLDRIDQRALPLDGLYTYETTASNVQVYVIDTGIRLDHQEFTGRLIGGFDAVTNGGSANDCNGHGTHVAGTIGGTVHGVAKQVRLAPIRVLNCSGSGTTSGVIAGVDWVTANAIKPAVANMSLGGGASSTLDDAVRNSVASGVTYAVAAGNGNFVGRQQPACNYSPARVREALTVGATTNADRKTSWSNYGDCVDLFAPGASITSAWHTSSTATNTISGTSMAAPHVAGVAALYLTGNPGATTGDVFQAVVDNATKHVVTHSSTANNHLVHSLFGATDSGSEGGEGGEGGDSGGGGEGGGGGEEPSGAPIDLSVQVEKVRGSTTATLTWSPFRGATEDIDVFVDDKYFATVTDTGITSHGIGRGSGEVSYQVCEAGTDTCSNRLVVSY